ncbi:hypothetical protein GCM10023235_30400 [Kitasatospora terrestris]|uniref:Tetratricopeptide repeat protein n=1 Tax=Kitasatospora terrestris TaxID=258051 RepID=A0ABP9DQ11_9ACTN
MGLVAGWGLRRARSDLDRSTRSFARREWAEAERYGRRAAASFAELLSPGHPATLECRMVLAYALDEQGRWAESEQELRLALEGTTGADHGTERVVSLSDDLACLLRRTGRLAEAEAVCRRALAGPVVDVGPFRTAAQRTLAMTVGDLGRHAEAAELYRSIAGSAAAAPAAQARSNVLSHLAYLGRYEEVEAEAEALGGTYSGLDDAVRVRTALSVTNSVAIGLAFRGRHGEAEALLRPALADAGRDGLDDFTVVLGANLARALTGQGRGEEALAVVSAVAGDGGPEDESTLAFARASAQLAAGRFVDAEADARKAVELCGRYLAPVHHRTLEARTVLAAAVVRQGRPEGEELREAVLADWVAHFGAEHHGARQARGVGRER